MRRRKLCILTSSFPRFKGDSVSPFIFELCKYLSKRGYEIHVVVPHYPRTPEVEKIGDLYIHRFVYARPKKVQILTYGERIPHNMARSQLAKILVFFYIASMFSKSLSIIRKYKIDVVIAFWAIPQGIVGFLIKKLMKKPLLTRIFPVEIALSTSKYTFSQPFLRKVITASDVVIPNSFYTLQSLVRLNCHARRIEVIWPGVDPKKFAQYKIDTKFFHRYGIQEEDKIILAVGRLVERKGFKYLIEAISLLQNEIPRVKLLLVGSGPKECQLKSLAAKMKLKNRIVFIAEISEKKLIACYSRADVFVLPAIVDSYGDTEGLGVVLLEAMAKGRPIVATKVGGIPEAVLQGVTGLLVQQKDSVALAKAIRMIFSKPKLGETLGKAGRKLVREKFSWSVIATKFDQLITNLTEK